MVGNYIPVANTVIFMQTSPREQLPPFNFLLLLQMAQLLFLTLGGYHEDWTEPFNMD